MTIFSQYLKAGFQPLPIGYLTKYPCVYTNGEWKSFNKLGKLKEEPVTAEECKEWDTWLPLGGGVGIALGEYSGVIALDFDSDDDITNKIKDLLPKPPVMKVGSKGVTAFFKYNGEKNRKWRAGGKDYALELLSTGNQTVVPPSYHPATQRPYTWVNGISLLEFGKENLPSLPKDFIEKVDEITGRNKTVTPVLPQITEVNDKPTKAEIEEALMFISPDCGYDEWVEIGMAIKDELGESGFHVWDAWSSKGQKYPKGHQQKTFSKWSSFKNDGITIATLFKKAFLNGYQREQKVEAVNFSIPFIERLKLEASPQGVKERIEEGFPIHLCREATGLVGMIQKWIEGSAMFPQPVLALGASISVCGILMAHKAEGDTGSRTNMYCLGVAPSGSGKEHPRKCVETLLHAVNKSDLIGGDPASSTGLLKSLQNGSGKRIIQIDEFGRVLKGMTGRNASSHVAGLPTVMMKLFSTASSTFFGTEYANHDGKMNRQDIVQPCLCIHASTVPEHLYQAMTGTDAIDGFLSRWLIFENKGYPDAQKPKYDSKVVPSEIIEAIEKFDESVKREGNISQLGIFPQNIPFTPKAKEMADEFCKSMRKRAQEKQEAGDNTYAIWTRTFEHATKLAIVAHEDGKIDEHVMKWALEVATYCSQYIADQATAHIADNEHEKNVKAVIEIVKHTRKHGISKSEVIRKTQRLNTKERNDIIMSLLESEQIVAQQVKTKTRPITKYFYQG